LRDHPDVVVVLLGRAGEDGIEPGTSTRSSILQICRRARSSTLFWVGIVNSAALRNPGLKNVVTAREVELSVFTSVAPSRLPSSPVSTIREPALMGALTFCALLRVAFYLRFGLAFDANANMWQMQDVVWLRDSPFEAIYLMHMQPPLLNALYATALQLPVGAAPIFLQFLFVVASAVMVILIYGQLRHFGSRPARG
jgi:hypothetical protein